MANLKQQTETVIIDHTTGETLRQQVNTTINLPEEPPFIKVYLKDILYLSDLPKGHSRILYALLKRISWASAEDGMVVVLPFGIKKKIAAELNLKNTRTLDNAIQDLMKGNILTRIEKGVFQFNPYLFGKGDWQDIYKIRMTVDYTLEGKTFGGIISYKDGTETNIILKGIEKLRNNKPINEPAPRQTKTSKELEELYKTLQELKEQRADLQGNDRKAVQKQIDSINKKIKRREDKLKAIA